MLRNKFHSPNNLKAALSRAALFGFAILLAAGCGKSDPATYANSVSEAELSPTENVLRYDVQLQLSRKCSPIILVRESGTSDWNAMPGTTIMFLLPETEYEWCVKVGETYGPVAYFTTGELPEEVPVFTVEDFDGKGPQEGYLMQMKESAPGYITFCDMQGRVLWYESFEDGVRCAHFDPDQRKIAVLEGYKIMESTTGAWRPRYGDKIITLSLDGKRLSEFKTSAENSEYPHHEIKLTPEGNIIAVEAVIEDVDLYGTGTDIRDIWGDGYVVLTPEGKRLADWNIFSELDVVEEASWLNPYDYQYDLVHANSVSWDSEGNYYMTFHYIAEIWKIDAKTGKVLYRLGEHGNLSLDVPYAEGGFHAVVPLAPDKFLVNNNGRGAEAVTHAQIYEVDPVAMTAKRTLNVANKPEYSVYTGGNVEILPDGETLHFDSTGPKVSVFTDLEGNVLKVFHREDNSYRAFYFDRLW